MCTVNRALRKGVFIKEPYTDFFNLAIHSFNEANLEKISSKSLSLKLLVDSLKALYTLSFCSNEITNLKQAKV